VTKQLKIYICGPYSAQTEHQKQHNVNTAVDAGIAIFLKGHFPYIPHLTHFVDLRATATGNYLTWEDYIKWDLPWLESSDAVLCLGKSPGTDIEVNVARKLGKRIFYSMEEIPRVLSTSDSGDVSGT
jgi:hypothetical protein